VVGGSIEAVVTTEDGVGGSDTLREGPGELKLGLRSNDEEEGDNGSSVFRLDNEGGDPSENSVMAAIKSV
jgi:hypothetical protein